MSSSNLKQALNWTGRAVLVLLAPWGLWLALGYFELFSRSVCEAGNLVAAAIYYLCALPLSLIFSAETLREQLSLSSSELAILLMLVLAGFNLLLLKLLQQLLSKKPSADEE